jgi:diguanylate cyclase (GGDEF)-like protein/PAS domain S-box-containing protein
MSLKIVISPSSEQSVPDLDTSLHLNDAEMLVRSEEERFIGFLDQYPLTWSRLLTVLPDGIAFVDDQGVVRYANEFFVGLTGYARGELVGQNIESLVPSSYRETHVLNIRDFARDPSVRTMGRNPELTVLRRDGREIPVDIALAPLVLGDKLWIIVLIRDDSAERTAALNRAEVEQRFRLAFEDNTAPMFFTNLEDRVTAVNDAFCQMIGRTREEVLGHDSRSFTHPEDEGITEESHRRMIAGEVDQVRYTKRYLHVDGRIIVVEVSKSAARDAAGKLLYFIVIERDITEERALSARLRHSELYDSLTGLANRALFEDRLSQAHARVVRQGGLCAVLLLDLDDFKGVNDTHGHLVGDQLLVAVAHRFELASRSSDTLCRSGDDEFLCLTEGLDSLAQAEEVAARLLDVLAEPFSIAGSHIEQRASAGVVIWDATNTDYASIVQDADVALYEAKRAGKGRYVVFGSGMRQQAVTRFELAQELRHALHDGDLMMYYQPIVDLVTTEVVGFEALMRWQHPERGFVPPSVFIPLAEQSDLILELGSFAMREAVGAASSWERKGARTSRPYVTVNFSAHQFHDPGLVSMIEEALFESGLEPERLVIEITESVTLRNVTETLRVMERLKRLGVSLALDDFGTGFSSLSYLTLLQPKIIKIDQSFVNAPRESAHDDTLLETIVSLGNRLNMTVLAEGIETPTQLLRLCQIGCELGQGYLFSPAVPADQASSMVGRVLGSGG